MAHVAICAGTFDPPTLGHLNIIERALKIFDRLVVAVAKETHKHPTLSIQERVGLLKELLRRQKNVTVTSFDGLLVEFARKSSASFLVRGIRNVGDYEYESQMALANKTLHPEIETLFMMTEGKYSHLSSTIIKEIILAGGSCKGMIHPLVEKALRRKLNIRSQ